MKCRRFISFKELLSRDSEPANRGICTLNPYFADKYVEFVVINEEYCKNCKNLVEEDHEIIDNFNSSRNEDTCRKFISFRQLFRDNHEATEHGICTLYPIFKPGIEIDCVQFAIVDKGYCSNHCSYGSNSHEQKTKEVGDMFEDVRLVFTEKCHPNITIAISGSDVKVKRNKIIIRDAKFYIERIDQDNVQTILHKDHLKVLIDFLKRIDNLVETED